ncbi:MAG: RusA family crossover junction endodeoxyribonuclease [Firmicutes bacterium]|nr:RusA family crossover junction endodeoxyribonuclease [Bacillota bacterium]
MEFQIIGNPKAKKRARIGFRNGKTFRYTPKATRLYKKEVKKIYRQQIKKYFAENVPLNINITVFQERPKRTKSKSVYSVSKPDLYNRPVLKPQNNI